METLDTCNRRVDALLAKYFICEEIHGPKPKRIFVEPKDRDEGIWITIMAKSKTYATVKVTDYQADRPMARRYGTIVARFECFDAAQARAKWERDLNLLVPVKSQGRVKERVVTWVGDF